MVVEEDWLKDLPNRWSVFRLSEGLLTDIQPGFACGKTNTDGIGIPQLRPMNVNSKGNILFDVLKFVPKEEIHSNTRLVRSGDIIFNNTNSPELVGKTALYEGSAEIAFSNHMTRLRVNPDLLYPKFLSILLHFFWQTGNYKNICNNHVSQSSISKQALLSIPIPLPPLEEQHRIITEIEKLLARVEAAKERLYRVPAIMQQFRQSVLAAACSGRLTEGWREKNSSKSNHKLYFEEVATISNQLQRNRKSNINENIETRTLEFPESWKLFQGYQIFPFITSGSRGWAKYYSDEGYVFIRIGNLTRDSIKIDLTNMQRVTPPESAEKNRIRVKENDILISITADIGSIGLVTQEIPESYINQHIAIARTVPNVNPKYLSFFLLSPNGGKTQFRNLQRGATKIGLGLDDIRSLKIPIPPIEEQIEIVHRIDALFAHADRIESQVATAYERVETITHSILHQAFTGKLVPTRNESE